MAKRKRYFISENSKGDPFVCRRKSSSAYSVLAKCSSKADARLICAALNAWDERESKPCT